MTEIVSDRPGLRQAPPKMHATLLLLLIIFGACSIRFIGLGEKQLWVDEIIQVLHSRPDSIREIFKSAAEDRGAAPLDYVIQHFVMKAVGSQNETSARLHAAIFGSISVVLVYGLALGLLGESRIALISAALFAIYPFHHHYSQEARPYALFLFLALCLFILFVRARATFFMAHRFVHVRRRRALFLRTCVCRHDLCDIFLHRNHKLDKGRSQAG